MNKQEFILDLQNRAKNYKNFEKNKDLVLFIIDNLSKNYLDFTKNFEIYENDFNLFITKYWPVKYFKDYVFYSKNDLINQLKYDNKFKLEIFDKNLNDIFYHKKEESIENFQEFTMEKFKDIILEEITKGVF